MPLYTTTKESKMTDKYVRIESMTAPCAGQEALIPQDVEPIGQISRYIEETMATLDGLESIVSAVVKRTEGVTRPEPPMNQDLVQSEEALVPLADRIHLIQQRINCQLNRLLDLNGRIEI